MLVSSKKQEDTTMKATKFLSVILAALMIMSLIPISASAYSAEQATLTFTDSGITETVSGSGYTIKGTTLTINAAGTYRVKGSCSEGAISVKGGLSGVTLILDNLTLSSTTTAPISVKKASSVLMKLAGTSTITDNEALDESNSDFEGAAIKVKSGSSLTIFGEGTLNAVGTPKNAIKGAATSSLVIDGGIINATAANNGIAFDGSIVINAGTIKVTSQGDGVKSQPDQGDTESAGVVTINGGTFDINAQGDGIVAAETLTITNGDFTIKTLNGYNSSTFNKNTMSCKGLKASSNNEADSENPTCAINISGGTFSLNTADDAIHSDGYATVTGGSFDIYTGDDGVHADATLTLGTSGGYDRDPEITINSSNEGLEGSVVNIYSGRFYVVASDDGVNAAGGSSNGTDPGQGGNDQFRPGQGGPGGQGGQPGGQPGGQGGQQPGQQSSGNSSYSINVYGGKVYVNCAGDGLDSNGTLNLLGGDITVLSMQSGGDNSPLDADGTITINGATVFAAGSRGMGVTLSTSSQNAYTSSSSYYANTVINVSCSGSVVRSEKLVRNINYLLYSSPSMTSNSCSLSTADSVTSSKSNAWAHSWDNGTVVKSASASETGLIKYTCSDCSDVEYKTIPKLTTATQYTEEESAASSETASSEASASEGASSSETASDEGFTVNFLTDGNCTINVYDTQDYSSASATNVSSAVSKSSSTGNPDSSGDGQVNFTVVPAEGYEVESVTATPTSNYKNLKDLSDTLANTYRITKITGEVKVVVKTKAVSQASDPSSSEQQGTSSESSATDPSSSEQQGTSSESSATDPSSSEQGSSSSAAKTTVTLKAAKSKIYVGKSTLVKAIVKNASGKTVYTSSNTSIASVSSAGKVTAKKAGSVIISAKNNGVTAKIKITVVKKANTMTVKAKTIKAKKSAKTTFNKAKAFTIKKAKGTVVFKKVKGSKKITINSKTGRITVKKGLKKATYKLKVKITAKGTKAYKSKSKTVTVKVIVK